MRQRCSVDSAMMAVLPANQPPDRFYLGGASIAAFRQVPLESHNIPEDWVASTTCLAGEDSLGLTTLPDGRRLVDAIAADPEAWLGSAHVAAYGVDTKLLVKLLDAGQRLPVHAHPGTDFAARLLGRAHGKVEAWYMLHGADIHLGLRAPVEVDTLQAMVDTQDVDGMLGLLHERHVDAGDTVFVPAGTLHAIGEGAFLVELQEPEDMSILLEWRDFDLDGARDGHLGLGFEVALGAIDRTVLTDAQVDALITRAGSSRLLPPEADAYFRLNLIDVDGSATVEPGFAVFVVLEGSVAISGDAIETFTAGQGRTIVVPDAAGDLTLTGDGRVAICRPPRP